MARWHDEIAHIHENALKRSDIKPWSTEDVRFLALALCGEAGELANEIKKQWRGDARPNLRSLVAGELADVVVYAYLIEVALALDIDAVIEAKLPEIRRKFTQAPSEQNT